VLAETEQPLWNSVGLLERCLPVVSLAKKEVEVVGSIGTLARQPHPVYVVFVSEILFLQGVG